MALHSMTGFGRGATAANGWRVDVELSSVNRKQFDLSLALPRDLAVLEPRASALVHARVRRGHVKGSVRLQGTTDAAPALRTDAARAQVEALRAAAVALGLADDLTASALLRLPQSVLQGDATPPDTEALWPLVEQALGQALDALTTMRAAEGGALAADLGQRLDRLASVLPALRERAPGVLADYRASLAKRLEGLALGVSADDPSLLRELALFADRCDISEELTRLESHFAQARELLASPEPCGRALDFLCQELFREINTVGSKANDAVLAKLVIGFKAELEAFREQVQNVE